MYLLNNVFIDLLRIIIKKGNIIHIYIYNIFRNKRLYIYKKEGSPYSSVGRASDWRSEGHVFNPHCGHDNEDGFVVGLYIYMK